MGDNSSLRDVALFQTGKIVVDDTYAALFRPKDRQLNWYCKGKDNWIYNLNF